MRDARWVRFWTAALALVAAAAFVLGGYHLLRWQERRAVAEETAARRAEYRAVMSGMSRNEEDALRRLSTAVPAARVVRLRRQWRQARRLASEMQAIRRRPALIGEIPAIRDDLRALLADMREKADALLSPGESLPERLRWRVRNLRGCVRVMTAFVELESGNNTGPATVLLREAVSDFGAAILDWERAAAAAASSRGPSAADFPDMAPPMQGEGGDPAGPSRILRNRWIPRWNLEMLHGNGVLQRAAAASPGGSRRQRLQQGLETLIPGVGGFAAGAPLDRRVEK